MYLPGYYPPKWKPFLTPDIRVHIANWRTFKSRTGEWPVSPVALFVLRFVFIGITVMICLYLLPPPGSGTLALVAVARRTWAASLTAVVLAIAFTVDQTSRYIMLAAAIVVAALFYREHNFYFAQMTLIGVFAVFLAAFWGLLERFIWNFQLRSKRLSSNHDVWDVTQFPSDRS